MPFVTVTVDHVALLQCYQLIMKWLCDEDTNKSEVSRLTGISRNSISRLTQKDKHHELVLSNFIRLVKAYETMELGYNHPQYNPDDLAELELYGAKWKPVAKTLP